MAEIPMTELDAVNLMLACIGEAPVDTLNVPGLVELAVAQTKLENISRSVQAKGWWFNQETDYPLVPDVNDEIILPQNVLKIDTSSKSARYDVVERNRKLYDRYEHRYTFPDLDTLYVDIVWHLPFEQLPHQARWYIAVKASRRFQTAMVGSETLHGFNTEDEKEAYADFLEADTDAGDYNIAQDYSTNSIIYRHFNPR